MPLSGKRKKIALIIAGSVLVLVIAFFSMVNLYLQPALRKGLHTLIIQGSDSLYTYSLGKLSANVFGGNIEIENLNIVVDSPHYEKLRLRHALPKVTMQLSLQKGHIKGIGLLAYLYSKKIVIEEIVSTEANIRLWRQLAAENEVKDSIPLWKAIRPSIKGIEVDRVRLDGLKFLYRGSDTAQSLKFQFDRIEAGADDIKIDSAAAADTNRVGFSKDLFVNVHDLKFRTADSSYKMKAEWIRYSTRTRTMEIDSFKMQPTLERKDFYDYYGLQASMYYLEVDKARVANLPIDRFVNQSIFEADSILLEKPRLSVYLDKTQEKKFESKIGKLPHQRLLNAAAIIRVRNIESRGMNIIYTEKNNLTHQEGTLKFSDINLRIQNATNDRDWISRNPLCTAHANGHIFQKGIIDVGFKFFLDSTNGSFAVKGSVSGVDAPELNTVAIPLGNTELQSLHIEKLSFDLYADDYTAWTSAGMRYRDLFLVLRKIDPLTGKPVVQEFFTKVLNKYGLLRNNPDASGRERSVTRAKYMRLTTQSFFGFVWKGIFTAVQDLISQT